MSVQSMTGGPASWSDLKPGSALAGFELFIPTVMATRSTAITLDDFPGTFDSEASKSMGLDGPLVITMTLLAMMDRVATEGVLDPVCVVYHDIRLESPAYAERVLRATGQVAGRSTVTFAGRECEAMDVITEVWDGHIRRCCSGKVSVIRP